MTTLPGSMTVTLPAAKASGVVACSGMGLSAVPNSSNPYTCPSRAFTMAALMAVGVPAEGIARPSSVGHSTNCSYILAEKPLHTPLT